MAGSTLRWGILGTARIAKPVIAAIRATGAGDVVAVASRTEARAKSWAAEHDIPRAFGSYEALLSADAVDVVYVPLPNSLHAEWTIKSLEAGLPVLCEKPFAITAAEARNVRDVALKSGVPVAEAFMYRFHPVYDTVVELILQGAIGDIQIIDSHFSFFLEDRSEIPASAELGGGSLMDVGCYCVNFARLVAGAEPIGALAFEQRSSVDDTLVGILKFDGGAIAKIEGSIAAYERGRAEVVGTKGTIVLANPWFPGEKSAEIILMRAGKEERITTPGGNGYELEVADFAAAVSEGRPPRWTIDDAIANTAVIEALLESARTGAIVAL